jgi:predicted DNA-binding protein with PD1-like motif
MRATQLHDDVGLQTYLLVMDMGDEAIGEITAFAKQSGLTLIATEISTEVG